MSQSKVNHPYYHKTRSARKRFSAKLIAVALVFNGLIWVVCFAINFYLPAIFSVYISLILIAPFIDVPAMVASGKLTYFSPFLLAEKEKNDRVNIHGGTLLDYAFAIERSMSGKQRRKFILRGYLKGLIKLIDWADDKGKTRLKITGTTPILNKRTAAKLGFKVRSLNFIQLIILLFNYPNLTVGQSIANAQLSLPRIARAKTIEADIEDLKKRREYMEALCETLK